LDLNELKVEQRASAIEFQDLHGRFSFVSFSEHSFSCAPPNGSTNFASGSGFIFKKINCTMMFRGVENILVWVPLIMKHSKYIF